MAAVKLCSVAQDLDHLVETPLQQAQVPFTLDRKAGKTVVLISRADVDRSRAALEKFGTFADGGRTS